MSTSPTSFPFPRRSTPSDTLFYSLYPPLPSHPSSLSSLHLKILSLLSPHISSYIFHRDSFHLSLSLSPFPHLTGKTHFGDSISDEWFVVSLLFLVSKEFPELVVKVWDSDGEFLLIEAAFVIPDWLDPDCSDNRVFVKNGEVHIVSKEVCENSPSLEEGLEIMRDERIETRASDEVQKAIMRKIEGYPEKGKESLHRVRVRVPLKVAQVLKMESCLISLAVEGFYDRDIDTMKHAARMEKFLKGEDGEIEMVRVSVIMTRAMYGQLTQQRFQPPRGYPMPSTDNPSLYMEAELGLKITCGFEMMYQERRKEVREEKGNTWEVFKKSLEKIGCFEGFLEGSKEYNRVLEESKEYYKSTSLASRTREIIGAPIRRIDEILSLPYSSSDFNSINLPPNDDDSWLYGGEKELDSEILEREREMEEYESKKNKKGKKKQEDIGESSSNLNEFNLGEIAASMQEFVKKVSSFEGAEVPDDKNSKDVQIDADQFFKAMESVFNRKDEDEEESTSEMDMDFDDFGDDEEETDDDNENDMFMESYSDALNKELSGSTVNKSFVRAEKSNNNQVASNNASNEEAELAPVDVDFNLMKSFLDSFSSQQGLPGPASNLLGLMGLNLPPPDQDSGKKA